MTFKIDNIQIGESHPPYIIAELSANHNGSIQRAKDSIKAASENGASGSGRTSSSMSWSA